MPDKELVIKTRAEFRQAIMNGAWRGLASQQFKACRYQNRYCALWDGRGKYCAIGWLIPPERRSALLAQSGVYDVIRADALHPALMAWVERNRGGALDDLDALRRAHDLAGGYMQHRLRRLAADWAVQLPELV